MSGTKQIFNKEMARIFKDKKMVFSTFILPVVIMYAIMTLVGNLATNMMDDIETHTSQVYVVNAPNSFKRYLKTADAKLDVKELNADKEKEWSGAKKDIIDGKMDVIVEFPSDFEMQIASYENNVQIPQIKAYYNPSEDYSNVAYDMIVNQYLEGYRQMLLGGRVEDLSKLVVFTVNTDNEDMVLQDEDKASGKAVGMMLPYMVTILLFAGAMGIGTDMIAGEKERGTMASLLISPIKRSSIVLGKILALMVLTGISSLIYVGTLVLLTPRIMQGGVDAGKFSMTPSQIGMMAVLLVAIAFLYASIIVLFSVFAKSVKEASSYVMPAYMLILVIGLITMFVNKATSIKSFLIPIYNNALALQGILGKTINPMGFAITLIETLALGLIMQLLIIKAFNSEKLMNA